MNSELLPIDDPQALKSDVVGTKAAGLARLRLEGFDVPEAVVLTVAAAQNWAGGPAPDALRKEVEAACQRLGPRLAVRSSATWEDGATSAHAGATETVLGVSGVDATLAAMRHCLDASAVAQRALAEHGDIAVILQTLVDPDHAGVAFTADPLTGERAVVRIAATKGLGEALVQGEVVGSDVTIRGDEVDGDLAGLSVDDALSVATVARAIETAFGRPQDVEWAVVDGHVHVLQARPITVLPIEPKRPEGNNWQKDVAHYPEPLTPFGWSIFEACNDDIAGVFDEMGMLVRGLEEEFVGGEIYGRVLPAFGSANDAGKPPPAVVLGIAARVVPALRRRTAAAKAALEADLPGTWTREWHSTDRAEMAQRAAALGNVDLTSLDDAGLRKHANECITLVKRGMQIHFRLVMPLFSGLHRLHSLVSTELGWDDSTIATMFAGHSPASRAAEEALAVLRERMRAIPGATEALRSNPGHPIEALEGVDAGLGAALAGWSDEHGWSMVNYDAGVPVLAERPTTITRLLLNEPAAVDFGEAEAVADKARAALPDSLRTDFDDALSNARAIYAVRDDNTIVVGDRPFALMRRWMHEVADRLVARGTIASHADAVYLGFDELSDALAGTDGGAADQLTERISLRRGEEAWVRANPGPLYLGDQGEPPETSKLPTALRQVNEPVLWGISHEYPAPVEVPADADVLLAGVAASAGVAEGPVRIIRGHGDMHLLQQGDVLVCQVTSPAWAPLFPLAAAVVADGGGALSHAAIASREHGVPAVLGTANGTSTLRDGQRVRVDGTSGLIYEAS